MEQIYFSYKDDDPYIMLLGDYNDEPFDRTLSEQLKATRDYHLAKNKKKLLYNPFWVKLGSNNCEDQSGYGSYYHNGGDTTKWRTFDQIIFSSSFLGNSVWQVNENLTQVIRVPGYIDLVISPENSFDHFPVCSVIERRLI